MWPTFVTCSQEIGNKLHHAVPSIGLKTVVRVVKLRFLHYVVVHSFLHHICAPFCCIRPINALNSVNDRHTGRFDTDK